MASPVDEDLPGLPPIKTTPLLPPVPSSATVTATSSASSSPSPASSASAVDSAKAAEEEDREPSTPTSEGSRLRSPAVCPPAPRKPPAPRLPAKRKPTPAPARVFVAVPRDLSTVFRSLSPKKRIRVS